MIIVHFYAAYIPRVREPGSVSKKATHIYFFVYRGELFTLFSLMRENIL